MSFAELNKSIWLNAYSKLTHSNKLNTFIKQGREFVLKNCYTIVNINGVGFEEFANRHEFNKPNDLRGKLLIDQCAKSLVDKFKPHILLSYGFSDQYSFVINKSTNFCERNLNDILSLVVSNFTANYVFNWSSYFDKKLEYAPSFRGDTMLLPSESYLIKHILTKQHECYILNLNSTLYSALVGQYRNYDLSDCEDISSIDLQNLKNLKLITLKDKNCTTKTLPNSDALDLIRDKVNTIPDINEYLFKKFNINYNNEPEIFKKGTLIYLDSSDELQTLNTKLDDESFNFSSNKFSVNF